MQVFELRLELGERQERSAHPNSGVGVLETMSLYVCTGGGCKDKNAKKLRAKLKELVKERGLNDRIKVKKADCMGDCGKGPIVKIKPGKRTFTRVNAKKAGAILDEVEKALDAK